MLKYSILRELKYVASVQRAFAKKSLYLRMRASLHAQDIYNLLSHICNLCCTNVMYLSITNRAKMTDMDEEMCLGMLDISFPYYLMQRLTAHF